MCTAKLTFRMSYGGDERLVCRNNLADAHKIATATIIIGACSLDGLATDVEVLHQPTVVIRLMNHLSSLEAV